MASLPKSAKEVLRFLQNWEGERSLVAQSGGGHAAAGTSYKQAPSLGLFVSDSARGTRRLFPFLQKESYLFLIFRKPTAETEEKVQNHPGISLAP